MSIASSVPAHFEAPAASSRRTASLLPYLKNLAFRFVDLVHEANERRASREIGRFVDRNGGVFTDDLERRIGDRFIGR